MFPKILLSILITIFVLNQFLIGRLADELGFGIDMNKMVHVFGTNQAMAMEIMMPVLNEGGKTTHLQMMPTITEVAGDPNSGDLVADAMTVMMGTGTTFYAPDGVTFDDPVGALTQWGTFDQSISLDASLETRFKRLGSVFPCSFCCGSPTQVTVIGRCGCAHARAARGFFKYMLSNYGDEYSDDQLVGEAYRWQAIWYPAGVVEDYLLATGRGDEIGHKTHGGAGSDGMHETLN